MPKLHLRQPEFTYSACAWFTKHRERIQKFRETTICDVRTEIIYNTEVLHSNLCNYNDSYILVRADIPTIGHRVAFKICIPALPVSQKLIEQQQMMLKT